jgi:hypothetical protein
MFSKEQPMVLPVKEGKAICKVNDCLWESQTKRRFSCVCGFGCTSDAASESFHRPPKSVFAVGCMQKTPALLGHLRQLHYFCLEKAFP